MFHSTKNPHVATQPMFRARRLFTVVFCALLVASVAGAGQQKLYVLHSLGHEVSVIDLATNEIIGTIDVGDRPHGVAAPASQELLYVSAEFDHRVVVIDTRTDKVVKGFDVARRPNEIDVTSDGRYLIIPALQDGIYQIYDTAKEAVVKEIPTDGFPHNAVVSPDDRYVFFSAMDRGTTPAERIKAMDLPTSLNDKVYVVDLSTLDVVSRISTGDAPRPIAVSPDGKFLYANVDGLQGFAVLDLEKEKMVSRVEYELTAREKAMPSRSHGIYATPDGKEVWTSDVNHGTLYAFDVTETPPKQLARVETGIPVYWLTGTPDGKTLFVTSAPNDAVTLVDIASRKVTGTIKLPKGSAPKRMLVVEVPDES